ncbi:hypothetical protein G6F67_007178 [Rhizopus microsporus]|nr:hypothetical protein G6F67_007178 [Rhizopus microsporus]
MYKNTPNFHYDSFEHTTPNSRMIPPPSTQEYHTASMDQWKQVNKPLDYERESLIDPSGLQYYTHQDHSCGYARDVYIGKYRANEKPNKSTIVIDRSSNQEPVSPVPNMAFFHSYQQQEHNLPNPQVQVMCQPKSVRSNVQHVAEIPLQIYQAYAEPCTAAKSVQEAIPDKFLLQPVPKNKKHQTREGNGNNNNNSSSSSSSSSSNSSSNTSQVAPTASTSTSRMPKPPLTPLVIPPTPIRSSSSPNRAIVTPTRSSSIPHDLQLTPGSMTPGSMTPGSMTPGSSRSAYSPHGFSPFTSSPVTPSPNTLLPHTVLPIVNPPDHKISHSNNNNNNNNNNNSNNSNNNTLKVNNAPHHKKQSIVPDNAAERFVHEGIKFHELGKLEQAAEMFKQAAAMELPMGMFLYGISIRHGWGCKKNEHLAFQYLQKAAEHAVEDLEGFSNTVNTSAAKGELIMAIYELGVSFRHGWGCKKNKETAAYYFKIAADLNDPDAQNDLGHCYYHGHGVKKDLKMAAKYYRMADKQGQGIMGNSWIWKSKYD